MDRHTFLGESLGNPLKMNFTVVGAGASGMFAAITAARQVSRFGATVHVLEATRKPMKKILLSGGGRCNVLHRPLPTPRDLTANYPRGHKELIGPFTTKFTQQDTYDWFEEIGVPLKVEEDGRCFPITDSSETVANALRTEAEKLGVDIRLGCKVTKVMPMKDREGNGWHLHVRQKNDPQETILAASHVMLATGSSLIGHKLATDLDLHVTPLMPSLFSFRLQSGHLLEGLQGVTLPDVELGLLCCNQKGKKTKITHKQRGPLLVTHRGLSGPAALKLSSFAAKQLNDTGYTGALTLNCLPAHVTQNMVRDELHAFANEKNGLVTGGKHSLYPMHSYIPRRVWQAYVCSVVGHDRVRWTEMSKHHVAQLCNVLFNARLAFVGKDTNKEEFVTAGGVDLKDLHLQTMETKRWKHLYVGGELLNVDGVTGGFNFQSCWTTGHIVGQAVSASISKR